MRTSSGLPSDSAELFPLLFCRLNRIARTINSCQGRKTCQVYPGPSLRISSSLLRLSGSLCGLLEGVTLPPLLRLGPPWSSWGLNTEKAKLTHAVSLTVRDEVWANFCCLVMVGILYGKLGFCSERKTKNGNDLPFLFYNCTCMHPLKKVLHWVFCAPWREMRMKVVGICRKELRGVLGASLLTAFVGSVIGFTQTSGCPLLAGDPDALWKSPARSGADPEVP